MSYTLIPGLESFMEDTEVNVEVAVDAPEAIEEAEETAEASAEIAETSEEAESTDEQTEMIMSQFMELGKRYEHVKKYGVDRTFMRLFNANGELSRSFRYRFPSCESFDSTGSPYSSESVACMEGLGDALKAVWDFIVNLCKKIGAFFGRLFEAIRVRFGNLNDQIGRLREMASERTSVVDNIDDVDATTYKLADLQEMEKYIGNELDPEKNRRKDLSLANMETALNQLEATMLRAERYGRGKPDEGDTSPSVLDQTAENAKKTREAFKDLKKDTRKKLSDIKDSEKIKDLAGSVKPEDYLDLASKQMKFVDDQKSYLAKAKVMLANANKCAENMKRRQDEGNGAGERKGAAAMGTYLNVANQWISLNVEVATKVAGMCVRAASTILRYKKKA